MSSLKGDGSGVIETEEVSILASVSIGEEEISSGVTEDRGRRTPWPVGLPGLSGDIHVHFNLFVHCLHALSKFMVSGSLICLLWVKTQTICTCTLLYILFQDQIPLDLYVLFILRSCAVGSF